MGLEDAWHTEGLCEITLGCAWEGETVYINRGPPGLSAWRWLDSEAATRLRKTEKQNGASFRTCAWNPSEAARRRKRELGLMTQHSWEIEVVFRDPWFYK